VWRQRDHSMRSSAAKDLGGCCGARGCQGLLAVEMRAGPYMRQLRMFLLRAGRSQCCHAVAIMVRV
jgi:hypothetical protein